ncbi:Outer membrane protein assembly factor BamB [Geodia barretti]|uniref:Outer membrane protein assembly factor BamB n=1 Tax=Geodia barretti TaxID=519541 RepID=A0AA35WXC3_GEOBA|nr:Outer membrane protein assembly factor BamB [Geodia barretti]
MAGGPGTTNNSDNSNERESRFSVPQWARPGDGPSERIGWRTLLRRRRLLWAVVAVVVLVAVWNNYPFIPNLWTLLFSQPSGVASAESGPGQWAMRGGSPQGTNFSPFTFVPEGIVERAIEVDTGIRSSPVAADGVVYIGGQSRMLAIDADTGQQIWEQPVSGPAHGVPALADGSLFLGTLNKRVIALDARSGRRLWEYVGDSPFPGTVAVQDGIVYAGSRGGDVHAIDASSGDQLWKVGLKSAAVAPVAVHDGKMFAASSAGILFIRHSGTGDKRARIRTNSALVSPPTVADGRVYLLLDGSLLAFDSNIRELPGRYASELIWAQLWVWGFPLPSPAEHSGLLWRLQPGNDVGAFLHTPAVTGEALYLGTGAGEVVALDPENGDILWQLSLGEPIAAPVIAAGNVLLVAQENGAIRAIDRYSQEELWKVSLESPVAGPLGYAEGRVFAHTQDGKMYVIR